jgi:hypothetical protein
MRPVTVLVALTTACTLTVGAVPDSDWPHWRGPNRDGAGYTERGRFTIADQGWPS